jgi:hypothetical protein
MNRRIDCDYRERTHQKIAEHTNKVREIGEQIRRICNMTPEQCEIEVKYSPFEPSFKAIVLNSTVAFFSVYSIEEVPQTFAGQTRPNLDHEARGMVLEELARDSAIFGAVEAWFEKVWNTFAVPTQPAWQDPNRSTSVFRQTVTRA